MTQNMTLDELTQLVGEKAVAIRGRAKLEPAGRPEDKVFPPSHSVGDNEKGAGAKYAFEERRRGGEKVPCVLLDSVQSQANRMEEALQALWADKRLTLPVIEVDLSKVAPEVGKVTSLSAPHRVADAILRDSLISGSTTLFRMSEIGKSFTDASPRNAGPLFKVCPTGLVFGIWDSTGPEGGRGAKFARVLTSEIVGIGATSGVKTASRIDPTSIVTASATIYVSADPGAAGSPWTHDWHEAKPIDPDKPLSEDNAEKWGKKEKAGKPSAINHSNFPPTMDKVAGGVTIDHAEQTVVLSLAGLRRLGFTEGGPEARTVLAALGLVAVLAGERAGHDLRSRCLLVPRWAEAEKKSGALALEAVARDGSTTPLTLDLDAALALYEEAVKNLPAALSPAAKITVIELSLLFHNPPSLPR
ncbi:MAG TPA: type I-U CRISPR-associated RAMP protein Csb1/Cas7u [Bryobacteraceae bacterium]